MMLVDAGRRDPHSIDAKILFAQQLASRGHDVAIDAATLPDKLHRTQKYELAPLLVDTDGLDIDRVLVIGAHDVSDETLIGLRAYDRDPAPEVVAIGRFADPQSSIGTKAKLAYALGREPLLYDLDKAQPSPLLPAALSPLAAAPIRSRAPRSIPEVVVFLPTEALDDPSTLPMLGAMNRLSQFRLSMLIAGRGKEQIQLSRFVDLTVHGIAEVSPGTLAALSDIAVFFGEGVPGERMATLALDLMRAGGVVIDGTDNASFVSLGAPALRGPTDLMALPNYLESTVLLNHRQIGAQTRKNAWLDRYRVETVESAIGLPSIERLAPSYSNPGRTVFIPTNGTGLGHARRSLLVAAACNVPQIEFAAFPSCVPMVTSAGYPCMPLVQRTEEHSEDYANDLVNYLRLSRRITASDRLIFDGGYVFDSIYRTILEKNLRAVWIRRGLWRADQSLHTMLDREKAFETVIVPDEVFEELNGDMSHGPAIRHVGPVVDVSGSSDQDRKTRKRRILEHFGRAECTLAVTMLGGGIAADRTAQIQSLSSLFESRKDCLHLVVVWPGAKVAPTVFGWSNTRIVRSRHALSLAELADFVVSAAGYNSFHELLYNGIPAIFIPQIAPFMDDQERRARAASDRQLAETVLAHELLRLERLVTGFLDGDAAQDLRSRLAKATFPRTGMEDAAELVQGGRHEHRSLA